VRIQSIEPHIIEQRVGKSLPGSQTTLVILLREETWHLMVHAADKCQLYTFAKNLPKPTVNGDRQMLTRITCYCQNLVVLHDCVIILLCILY